MRRHLRWTWLLLGCVLAACAGGSGSSGFDISASENAAISQALSEQRCVADAGLTICPVNQGVQPPAPSPTPTSTLLPATPTPPVTSLPAATATAAATAVPSHTPAPPAATPTVPANGPPNGMSVDTGLTPGVPLSCVLGPSGCRFVVPFEPVGFPPDATFSVAARQDESGGWRIAPATASSGTTVEVPSFSGTLSIAVGSALVQPVGSGATVQLAVLVFVQPPASVPAQVVHLADSGAAFAFVTGTVNVQPLP
jgi:hypothetical protein